MSSWPFCDSFVGYDPPNFCIGPQDCKFMWGTQLIFGKPAKIKQLKNNSIKICSQLKTKDKVIQITNNQKFFNVNRFIICQQYIGYLFNNFKKLLDCLTKKKKRMAIFVCAKIPYITTKT